MSQHDFNIANQTFPSFRSDLNDALQASATMSAGSSAPTTPYAYQLWFDTTTDTWKVRNSGNTAWISTITTDLATGNVGIGNSSPQSRLDITGAGGGSGVAFKTTDASLNETFYIQDGGRVGVRYTPFTVGIPRTTSPATNAIFQVEEAGYLTVLNSGNVGIGTSLPNNSLQINGGATDTAFQITNSATGSTATDGFSITVENPTPDVVIRNREASNMRFLTSNTERLRIDSSGRVGIGTINPAQSLEIVGATASSGAARSNVIITDNTAYAAGVGGGIVFRAKYNTAGSITNMSSIQGFKENSTDGNYAGGLLFTTRANGSANEERMRIDSNGSLLLGTLSKGGSEKFALIGGPCFNMAHASTGTIGVFRTGGISGSIVGSITITGSSTAYNTSSDYRLKTAVNYDWDATTRLKQLRPARFEWIADGDDAVPVDGFLAHEVQDVVPEAITGTKDGMRDEEYTVSAATGDIYTPAIEAVLDDDGLELTAATDEVIHSTDVERPEELAEGQQWRETTAAVMGTRSVPDYQGIDQSKLVPLLVKTIQELEARITALEAS
jgi:hypothetical protein